MTKRIESTQLIKNNCAEKNQSNVVPELSDTDSSTVANLIQHVLSFQISLSLAPSEITVMT